MKRTNYAGLIDEAYLDQTVTLQGWVQKRRDLGGLIFVDLRDREGIVNWPFQKRLTLMHWRLPKRCVQSL